MKGVIPVCGCRKPYQVRELSEDIEAVFNEDEMRQLEEAADQSGVKILKSDIFRFAVYKDHQQGQKIRQAYRSSKDIYDDVLAQRNIFSKLYIRIFWSGTDDRNVAERILSWIPDDFTGSLLDVPAGTAVFTEKKWRRLNNAHIICLDYSEDMLSQARRRLSDCGNITFLQGDVGHLPMPDASFDIVVSMNGFHAFPDKASAFREVWRVLKTGGTFIACFYIREESAVTDCLVKRILSRKGWFTPPFISRRELEQVLVRDYSDLDMYTDGSIVCFKCVKQ